MKIVTGDENGLWKIIDVDRKEITKKFLGRDYTEQARSLAITSLHFSGGAQGFHESEITIGRANGVVEAYESTHFSLTRRRKIDDTPIIYTSNVQSLQSPLKLATLSKSGAFTLLNWSDTYTINDPIQWDQLPTPSAEILHCQNLPYTDINAAASSADQPGRLFFGGREVNAKALDIETGKITWEAKNVRPDDLCLRVPVHIFSLAVCPTLGPSVFCSGEAEGRLRLFDIRLQRRAVVDTVLALQGAKLNRPIMAMTSTPIVRTVPMGNDWGVKEERGEERRGEEKRGEEKKKEYGILSHRLNRGKATLFCGDNIGTVYSVELRMQQKMTELVSAEQVTSASGFKKRRLMEKRETQQSLMQQGAGENWMQMDANHQVSYSSKTTGTFKGASGGVRSIKMHPDLTHVSFTGLDRHCRVFEFVSRKPVGEIYIKQKGNCVLFSAEEKRDVKQREEREETEEEEEIDLDEVDLDEGDLEEGDLDEVDLDEGDLDEGDLDEADLDELDVEGDFDD